MARVQNSYDSPAYQPAPPTPLGTAGAGSGAVTQRFAAFTTAYIKSISIKPVTAGTSNDICSLITLSGTTTTTTALATFGSAATAGTNVTTTLTLGTNDAMWVVKGTDATAVYAVGAELRLTPQANYNE